MKAPAIVDGVVMEADQASIPITDEGLLRGDGVFEVMRLYDGRPFALEDHLERMAGSAARLRLPLDRDAVAADVATLLAAAGPVDAALRVLVTRGGRRIAIVETLKEKPALLAIATITYSPTRILDQIKSLSYAANMLASRLAQEAGADEALLVTPHGRVLEAPTTAFFYVLDGELCTPPLSDHILDSITRRRILDVTGARERVTTLADLSAVSEAFLASTLREVHPIASIDGVALPHAPGPVSADAAARIRERIEAELAASA